MPCWTVPCSRVFFHLRELTARPGKENKFLDFDVIWLPMLTHSCFIDTNHQNLLKSRSHHALYTSNWLDFEFAIKNTKRWQETPRQREKKREVHERVSWHALFHKTSTTTKNPHIRTQYRTPLVLHGYASHICGEQCIFSFSRNFTPTKTLQSTTGNKIVSMNWHRPRTLSLSSRHYHHSADSFNLSSLHT